MKLVNLVSLRKFLNSNAVQHVGVNVYDMALSKEFYCDILGGIFISEINGISGEEWTSILNGGAKNAPQLGKGDALDVCFVSFGNIAIELLRYYNKDTGMTHQAPVVLANEQGVAGMHISFNLSESINSKEFFQELAKATQHMHAVSLNKSDVHRLGSEGELGGWNCFFMSGPNGERIEVNQIAEGCNAARNFGIAADKFLAIGK